MAARDVATYAPEDAALGNYYVLHFQVPDAARQGRVEHAYLEFYLDVASREVDGYRDEAPLVEVYALTQNFSGELDPAQFEPQTLPAGRNVAVGENRRVVADITEIVRSYVLDPSKNHGLVIGSLTGRRDGLLTIKEGMFAAPGRARITFFTGP